MTLLNETKEILCTELTTRVKLLSDPTVHNFTKDIIKEGLRLNPVDAYYDCKIALQVLRSRMRNATGFDWSKAQW